MGRSGRSAVPARVGDRHGRRSGPSHYPAAMDSDHVDAILRQWAQQRPDLDTGALSISARIVRVERFLGRATADVVAGWGLNEGELNVLAALRRAGPPFALTPTELYRGLLLSSGAMTNRIDRLEQQGLVQRQRDDADRRRVLVVLTDDGRALIDQTMNANVAILRELLAPLDEDERETLVRLLRRLLVAFEAEQSG
jgi:DNA-binding MarR family transcriptional regulator